jgi:tetratricopeptide (TPR) repeat protein
MIKKSLLILNLFCCFCTLSSPLYARGEDTGTAIGISVLGIIFFSLLFGGINYVKGKFSESNAQKIILNSNNPIELYKCSLQYFEKQEYQKTLPFLNKALGINPNYLEAKKLKMTALITIGDLFEFEKEASNLIFISEGKYFFENTQKQNFREDEQAAIFFNLAKAKKMNGEQILADYLKTVADSLNPMLIPKKI